MSIFVQFADVLTSYVSKATNKILVQIGHVVGEVTDGDNVEWWQHYGFASRPPKPTKGHTATQALVMKRGSQDIAFASQDMRALEIYGNINFGDTCVYSAGEDGNGQARSIYKADGSINHYTTDTNTANGRAVYAREAPDGFSWVAPWGTMRFDASGFHINVTVRKSAPSAISTDAASCGPHDAVLVKRHGGKAYASPGSRREPSSRPDFRASQGPAASSDGAGALRSDSSGASAPS